MFWPKFAAPADGIVSSIPPARGRSRRNSPAEAFTRGAVSILYCFRLPTTASRAFARRAFVLDWVRSSTRPGENRVRAMLPPRPDAAVGAGARPRARARSGRALGGDVVGRAPRDLDVQPVVQDVIELPGGVLVARATDLGHRVEHVPLSPVLGMVEP